MSKNQKFDPQNLDNSESISVENEPLSSASEETLDLKTVYDIPVKVSAVLGSARMQIGQFLKLSRGSVVALDRCVRDPIDIYVNERLVARGEIIVVDQSLGISMTEIVKSEADPLR
ncbi:MAG: flagellar motor switch protein FliN [Holosporales bacterium]|jgi:flagellar motor switch protein FliN/FliY|nr:flagellar motor switch protein FliN [Holosporales bacterium]